MVERKTSRKAIAKRKFYAINRDIKDARTTGLKLSDIAKMHSVSYETVRTIRAAGTWPKFEEMKRSRNVQRATGAKVPSINGMTADEATEALNQAGIAGGYVTRSDYRALARMYSNLHDRVSQLEKMVYESEENLRKQWDLEEIEHGPETNRRRFGIFRRRR
jgi:hypothetical protein